MHDQVTVVVGIDAKTIQQLAISCETWRMHRPEMWSMPWVLFWDWTKPYGISREELDKIERQLAVPHLRTVQWPSSGSAPKHAYASQRECMLSGHVWIPGQYVETPWHMKIDTDAIAHGPSDWLQAEWFGADGDRPVYVAPSWHYTKGVGFLGRLEEWGDRTMLAGYPRLNIPHDPTHLRVPHKRMCSWLSYYYTPFTRRLCNWLGESVGNGMLPVPSQDTTVWYAAARAQRPHRIVNMKALRWANYPKIGKLAEVAKQVLSGQESIVDA